MLLVPSRAKRVGNRNLTQTALSDHPLFPSGSEKDELWLGQTWTRMSGVLQGAWFLVKRKGHICLRPEFVTFFPQKMDLCCDFHDDGKASLHLMFIFAQEQFHWIDCEAPRHSLCGIEEFWWHSWAKCLNLVTGSSHSCLLDVMMPVKRQ